MALASPALVISAWLALTRRNLECRSLKYTMSVQADMRLKKQMVSRSAALSAAMSSWGGSGVRFRCGARFRSGVRFSWSGMTQDHPAPSGSGGEEVVDVAHDRR